MNFEAFERRAQELFDTIPTDMRGGVEYLSVEPRSLRHPSMAGVYTLGECATGDLDLGSEFGSEERSGIHLYWGSFRALARDDPDFDWEAELWETLTHELRHHRESGAGEDALDDELFRSMGGHYDESGADDAHPDVVRHGQREFAVEPFQFPVPVGNFHRTSEAAVDQRW